MVENGAFEFAPSDNKDYTALTAWEKVGDSGDVELTIQETDSVNTINPHYLKMMVKSTEMGHPEPFSLEYLGIGNEEQGEGFSKDMPLSIKQ